MVSASAAELFGDGLETITRYVDILASRGIDWGLIGPREADRLWGRHVLNSAVLAGLPGQGARVLDVGSGAGLPGVPLAIARPDLAVVLLEPLLRRYEFLVQVVDELELGDRVQVVRGRAEDLHDNFDVVTARAVAPLGKLLGWTKPLFLPDGELLALKGTSAADEVRDAGKQLRRDRLDAEVLEMRATPEAEPTHVVRVRSGGAH